MGQASKRVLVVDDAAPIRNLMIVLLEDAGYATAQAIDGAEAIEWLKSQRPDLVLLDLMMPNVDGWGVIEYLRTIPSPPPVVIVSGMHEAIPSGHLSPYVVGSLIKPFEIVQFRKMCETALALPTVIPTGGDRKEPRRTFVVQTTLLSDSGVPLLQGQLVQLSLHGFRMELSMPCQSGDNVRVAFNLPGREEPLEITGRVRWRSEVTIGAEIEALSPGDAQVIRELVGV